VAREAATCEMTDETALLMAMLMATIMKTKVVMTAWGCHWVGGGGQLVKPTGNGRSEQTALLVLTT
jgi:hypothetical protein